MTLLEPGLGRRYFANSTERYSRMTRDRGGREAIDAGDSVGWHNLGWLR